MKINILEIESVKKTGSLRAFVTFSLLTRNGPLTIYRARWIQQEGQRGYCQPPQEESAGLDGRPRFRPLMKWPAEWHTEISAAVMAEMRDHPHGLRQAGTATTEIGQEVRQRAGLENGQPPQ